jgi:imidazolonepropionase-like amidohydrolase
LKASFRSALDYTPQMFTISGSTSRFSTIDESVTLDARTAHIRSGKSSHDATTPELFFTIAGYSPVALQETLVRYWRMHHEPARIAILPAGNIEISDRGSESFDIQGTHVVLERYSVRGLVWGLETLWMDHDNNLAAVVTRDAEFDHFEAVREAYESGLTEFVASAARDQMAELAGLKQQLSGVRTGTLAFIGARLIDGIAETPLANATVVTRDGKIVASGPSSSVHVPDGAQRIDATGKYIIPGLWDMHAHYEQVEWGSIYLAAGVTTVRDVGNEFEFITAVRDKVNSGAGLGPHMLLAGVVDGDGPIALGINRVNSPEDAAKWVRKYHDAGFQQMKLYSSLKADNVKAVCADAHALGMTVTGHIPEGMTIYDGVADGMDQVNHVSYLMQALLPAGAQNMSYPERMKAAGAVDPSSDASKRLISFLKQHGTVIDDTAALFELGLRSADQPVSTIEPGIANVAPELREQLDYGEVPPNEAVGAKLYVHHMLEMIGALHRAGITIVAGTDQAVPGYSVYREIELYVQAGFTPLEALQAATIVPARVMKVDSETGTVESGKRADFDILDANPLDNIHNIRSVRWVVSNGTLYDPAPLCVRLVSSEFIQVQWRHWSRRTRLQNFRPAPGRTLVSDPSSSLHLRTMWCWREAWKRTAIFPACPCGARR